MRAIELLHDNDYYYIASEMLKGGELQDRLNALHEKGNIKEEDAAYVIK